MHRKHKLKKITKKEKKTSNRSYVIQKVDLNRLLNGLFNECAVVGAKATISGDYLFSYIHSTEELALDYPTTTNTLKEFFLPRQEELFEFKITKSLTRVSSLQNHHDQMTVFFGVHSCDARALNFLDRFFGQNPRDIYYWKRRNNAVLISIACNKPANNGCFCNVTSEGPFLQEGEVFDVQLVDLGLVFLIECNSSKGQALIKKYKHLLHKVVDTNIEERENLRGKTLKEFKHHYNLKKVNKELSKGRLSRIWEKLSQRCQSCGGCQFICPSCSCFYIQDINQNSQEGKQIRSWEPCVFSQPISKRFYCKLLNSFQWFGVSACVGCSRCSYACPANLNMESFIASISGSKHKYKYTALLKEIS